MTVLVVGASLGGFRTVQALRSNGYDGPVVLAGAEDHLPYDRPPLSKEFLIGEAADAEILLGRDGELQELEVEWRPGARAVSVDPARRVVSFARGDDVQYDHLVVATGARPRTLPVFDGWDGVHVLRTVDDSRQLRDALGAATSVAIVGGGFIGAEVASSARTLGCRVTVLEALEAPMARALGMVVGKRLGRLLTDAGVDLRCGVTVTGPEGENGRVTRVEVADAPPVTADVVVVGIGTLPNVEWLQGSGAEIGNGVACDDAGRVAGVERVYAVGDAAAWHDPVIGAPHRNEHWTGTTEQAEVVAQLIASGERSLPPQVPYVWSDQFGHRIQVAGRFAGGAVEVVRDDATSFVALARSGDEVSGIVAVDTPRALALFRKLLARRASWAEALDHADKLRA